MRNLVLFIIFVAFTLSIVYLIYQSRKSDNSSMEESFYYSNMRSQIPAFNRGNWKKLETCVRKWASEHESIYVATGPILTKDLPTIGPNAVSVPKYYYKIIIDSRAPELHGIGSHFPTKHLSLPYLTLP